ncbi:MAG: hypothetical protein ACR2QK_01660 [Acidimicrobiales bacterium]
MPRRNRVDPWGDLQSVSARGLFTGNRGCLVDDGGRLVRHHNGSLWITCFTSFRDWSHPLAAPRTWTPLFFLDDAVALAAGHRPCGLCRRADYLDYRQAVTATLGRDRPVLANELNRRLAAERLRRGRGLERRCDRILTERRLGELPSGTVVLAPGRTVPHILVDRRLRPYMTERWGPAMAMAPSTTVDVLTTPTSVDALANGFAPTLHPSATEV